MNAGGFGPMSASSPEFVPPPSNMAKRMRASAPAYVPAGAGGAAAGAGGGGGGGGAPAGFALPNIPNITTQPSTGGLDFSEFEMANPAIKNAAVKRYVNNYKLPNLKKGLTNSWDGGRKKRRSRKTKHRKTKRSHRSRSRRSRK